MFAITFVNLIFCVVILVVGLMTYYKKKNVVALLIALAFGLFGVSHVITLFGCAGTLEGLEIAIRFLAYLLVTIGVFYLFKKN